MSCVCFSSSYISSHLEKYTEVYLLFNHVVNISPSSVFVLLVERDIGRERECVWKKAGIEATNRPFFQKGNTTSSSTTARDGVYFLPHAP